MAALFRVPSVRSQTPPATPDETAHFVSARYQYLGWITGQVGTSWSARRDLACPSD
ncbi:hypothetical protein AN958_08255 [Leucoagaricus sp. SymC.cos]|nr:hypothetical protein AN958_08255 [Leucoagaricus sp. SymC.cos]